MDTPVASTSRTCQAVRSAHAYCDAQRAHPATEATFAAAAERSRQGKALRRALEEAGGAFVKLGQMLSTRTDLLPTEFLEELAQLQQGVPPAAWPEVRALIEEELNSPIDEVFADFVEVPMASASIGQVHVARLHDGREVAVKVQRPGILPLIERDTDIAMRIAAKLEQTASWARDLGITELARGFVASLDDELDYRVEVRNMKAMAITQARHPEALRLGVPACIENASTGKLLTIATRARQHSL